MLTIVYDHVNYFTLDLAEYYPWLAAFFQFFMVPAFFFISGFLCFKFRKNECVKSLVARLGVKSRQLLVPTCIFFSVMFDTGIHPWAFPGGYWFTLVLFEMFLIYYALYAILRTNNNWVLSISFFASIAIIFIISLPVKSTQWGEWLAIENLCNSYPFFVMGIICKIYEEKFFQLLDNKYLMAICYVLAIAIAITVVRFNIYQNFYTLYRVLFKTEGVMLILIIFQCFRSSSGYWSGTKTPAKVLKFVGKRTLDIYMIHYFFLFPSIATISSFLTSSKSGLLIFIFATFLTFVIVASSLLISQILRSNTFIAKWLFGANEPTITANEAQLN